VKEAVKEAYEEKQAENGHLSAKSMKGIFEKFEADASKETPSLPQPVVLRCLKS
jgi:hypothetical protein